MNGPEPLGGSLDPVIHPLNRLKICAALRSAGAVEGEGPDLEMRFGTLRDLVQLSDATLSKQLNALQEHGYISRHREYGSSRAKDTVWVSLTARGTRALLGHLHALQELAEQSGDRKSPPSP